MESAFAQYSKKRKRDSDDQSLGSQKYQKHNSSNASRESKLVKKIQRLGEEILASQENYNKLAELLGHACGNSSYSPARGAALVVLCKVFSEFLTLGKHQSSLKRGEKDVLISKWLTERYEQFCTALLGYLLASSVAETELACKILMLLVKAEVTSARSSQGHVWDDGLYTKILNTCLRVDCGTPVLQAFIHKYVQPFGDVRFHTFCNIRYSSLQPFFLKLKS